MQFGNHADGDAVTNAHSVATGVYTRIVMYGGSTLIALDGPDTIWQSRTEGNLSVRLVGGGVARLPTSEVDSMFLHRRQRRDELDTTVKSHG